MVLMYFIFRKLLPDLLQKMSENIPGITPMNIINLVLLLPT